MKDNDDDIQFETMPDWGGITLGTKDKSKEKSKPKPQPQPEKEYASLYEELEDKCNPKNFMHPFVLERFNTANEIYSQLRSAEDKSDDALIYLRNRCIKELNISFSTKRIYDRLFSIVNPEIYLKGKVYNAEKVKRAGELFDKLLKNQDDIRLLEDLEVEVMEFVDEYTNNDKSLEYSKGDTNGKTIDDAYWYEEYFFRNSSVREYLDKYPDGIYKDEAKYFLNHSMEEYVKKYPKGRYIYKTEASEDEDNPDWVPILVLIITMGIGLLVIAFNK